MPTIPQYFPLIGQLELTYRCNLNCIHCYCKGSENKNKELSTSEWKKIIKQLRQENCLWLIFTGGEPLVREDFFEIYRYAKNMGFLIILFSNGVCINKNIVAYFKRYPPYLIEITLNSIYYNNYSTITQNNKAFNRVMEGIELIIKNDLPLLLKVNCLKQNKAELKEIKDFVESSLLKTKKICFKADPLIYPRLNLDKTPLKYRLTPPEILELIKKKIIVPLKNEDRFLLQSKKHKDDLLYPCGDKKHYFYINPYGILKCCTFMHKFTVDLNKKSLNYGFYNIFPLISKQKFKTNSKCKICRFRSKCLNCPVRAFLETGDEENPVDFYCHLARLNYRSDCVI